MHCFPKLRWSGQIFRVAERLIIGRCICLALSGPPRSGVENPAVTVVECLALKETWKIIYGCIC